MSTTTITTLSPYLQTISGASGQSVILPDVTTCELSQRWRVFNSTAGTLPVSASLGQVLVILPINTATIFSVATLTGNTASSWYWTNQNTIGDTPAKSPTALGQALVSTGVGASLFQSVYPQTFRLTTGTTFNVPAGTSFLQVFLQGAGGGGQGSATTSGQLLVASPGGDTQFGNAIARGGLAGGSLTGTVANNQGGIGTIIEDVTASPYSPYMNYIYTVATGAGFNTNGAKGVDSRSGFGGCVQNATSPGAPGIAANGFGAGGGAASTTFGSGVVGTGGGAGGYLSFYYNAPPSTFTFSVGAAGAASAGVGSGNFNGGAGSPGLIVVACFVV